MKHSPKLLAGLILMLACASSEPASTPTSNASTSGGEHPSIPSLRPPGSQEIQARLAAEPTPQAYAEASRYFAGTDIAGFGLLFGMTAIAMQPNAPLRRRITSGVGPDGNRTGSIRLAPGAMPVRAGTHGSEMALSHLVELHLGPPFVMSIAVPDPVAEEPTWTLDRVRSALNTLVRRTLDGQSPRVLELDDWLLALARAGHLDGFAVLAFGAGFAEEAAAHAAAVSAARAWITTNPFRPGRPPRPDDWLPIPRLGG